MAERLPERGVGGCGTKSERSRARGGAAGRAGVGQEQQAEAAGGLLTHPASGRLLKPSLLPPPRVGTAVALAC